MGVFIQKIQTNWTKRSRSSPDSTLRNRVPEKFPIVSEEWSDSVFLQEIIFNEGGFDVPIKHKVSVLNEFQIREQRLDFNFSDRLLEIGFWNENQIRKKVGILNFNSWCQIKTNNRFLMEYTWGYYKIVYNVFYGEMNKMKDIMNNTKPVIALDFQTLLI